MKVEILSDGSLLVGEKRFFPAPERETPGLVSQYAGSFVGSLSAEEQKAVKEAGFFPFGPGLKGRAGSGVDIPRFWLGKEGE